MRKCVLFLLGVVSLAAACSTAKPGEEFGMKDQAAIREKSGDYVKAFNAKDVPQLLAVNTENLTFMPPNEPVLRGKDPVKTFYDNLFKSGATNLKLDVQEVSGHGPLAYQSGSYEMDIKASNGADHDRGKYLFVARKMNNTWRYEYMVWNSDLPPAGH